jgi:UDPglucose--hexose-1-phosphate uridylyltransferase
MPHPHGQIYAYPFVPLKLRTELDSCRDYHSAHGECLLCAMHREELRTGNRMVYENEGFVAYIPHFTDYPYGVFIGARRHFTQLTDLTPDEQRDLADVLRTITAAFDRLFNERFPYMMCMHVGPVNAPEYAGHEAYFHFHIEFYTPWRARGVVKYYASSESGAWAAANTRNVEDCASELREMVQLVRKA